MSIMPIWNLITSNFIELRFFRGGREIYLNTSSEISAYSTERGQLIPITREEALETIENHRGWIQFRFRLATVADHWSAIIRLTELEQILMQSRPHVRPPLVIEPESPRNYFVRAA